MPGSSRRRKGPINAAALAAPFLTTQTPSCLIAAAADADCKEAAASAASGFAAVVATLANKQLLPAPMETGQPVRDITRFLKDTQRSATISASSLMLALLLLSLLLLFLVLPSVLLLLLPLPLVLLPPPLSGEGPPCR